MTSILITGSADGLGLLAAQRLIAGGHAVTLHARTEARAQDALAAAPGAAGALTGDLSSIAQTRDLAARANDAGPFDAVIHNAGVGFRYPERVATEDGLAHTFAINVLAPYVLTALMPAPRRLVYLSSGLHTQGDADVSDLGWDRRPWDGMQAYCDSKLHDVVLAFAVARVRPRVFANAVTPGWVATKMGGPGATDDLEQGPETQAWLAAGDDPAADVTGQYLYHREPAKVAAAPSDPAVQEALLAACAELTGVTLGDGGR